MHSNSARKSLSRKVFIGEENCMVMVTGSTLMAVHMKAISRRTTQQDGGLLTSLMVAT